MPATVSKRKKSAFVRENFPDCTLTREFHGRTELKGRLHRKCLSYYTEEELRAELVKRKNQVIRKKMQNLESAINDILRDFPANRRTGVQLLESQIKKLLH